MSEDSTYKKRKLSAEEQAPHSDGDDSSLEDLKYLKQTITKEISARFEERFHRLEQEILVLKEHINKSDVKIEVKEPAKTPVLERKPKEEPKVQPKHTFGASSFATSGLLKPATPLNSFASNTQETPTAPNTTESSPAPAVTSPRPVFGATSSFGKNILENIKNRKNVFDSLPSQVSQTKTSTTSESQDTPAKAAVTSSFGAHSRFNNAFVEATSKKSFLDEEPKKSILDEPQAQESTPAEGKKANQQFKQVDLAPTTVHTGEEDEVSLYTVTAKIFELDLTNISEGWKERGLGPLHLNQSKNDKKEVRLVMRSQGLLRVVLNYKVNGSTELLKGLEASLTPGKFLRLNSVNSEGNPIQYLLKFANEVARNDLVAKVDELKQEIGHKED